LNTFRKLIGISIAFCGILLGAMLTGSMLVILLAYWSATETGGTEGRVNLLASAAIGALIGYGIYRLGRRIAR
jgi:hypothetical protein